MVIFTLLLVSGTCQSFENETGIQLLFGCRKIDSSKKFLDHQCIYFLLSFIKQPK